MHVLELGCGAGWNLALLRDSGATTVGYDFDRDYLDFGVREVGLDLRFGGVTEASRQLDMKFDLVILSHVVEHMPSPVEDVTQVSNLCSIDGYLYIEVPGLFNLHKAYSDPRKYWQNAHTFSFTLLTLRSAIEPTGFSLVNGNDHIRSLWQKNHSQFGEDYLPIAGKTDALRLLRYFHFWEKFYPVRRIAIRILKPLLESRIYKRLRSNH
jgi:SAM-dependent methyltransferase